MNKSTVLALLANDRNVERALQGLLARQTQAEQHTSSTIESNGRGFNYRDAEFGTSLANQVNKGWRLTSRQVAAGRKLCSFYWRQVGEILTPPAPKVRVIPTLVIQGRDMSYLLARYDRFQPYPGITQHA